MSVGKVVSLGDSIAIVLPRDAVESLRVGDGDTVYIVETPTGIQVTHRDADFEATIEAARQIMDEHDGTLRKLAK